MEAICIGEADKNIIPLINSLSKGKSLKAIRGIAYKDKNGQIVRTALQDLGRDIDDLPYPNYNAYMNPNIKRVYMISSRGCPNRCSFCCLHLTSRQIWRQRSYVKVVEEIEYITKKYPWVEEIQFMDDTMTLDNARII